MRKNSRHLGFTLIELAIVLVIIGLLIGGILVARSLISTGKNHAALNQVSQFDAAINNYRTKYNCIPGDCDSFIPQGNNNGKIEDANGTIGLGAEFSGEVANFWVQLEQAESIKISTLNRGGTHNHSPAGFNGVEPNSGGRFTATVTGKLKNAGTILNVPAAKIGTKNTGIIVTNDYLAEGSAGSLRSAKLDGAYIIGGIADITDSSLSIAPTNLTDTITPADAAAFDSKADDGNPQTGSIIAISRGGNCFTDAKFNTANTAPACSVVAGYMRLTEGKSASGGGPCTDPGTGGACESWNTGTCGYDMPNTTCPGGKHYDYGGCGCVTDACGNSCQYSHNPSPGCECVDDVQCGATEGNWDSGSGTCDCSSSSFGINFFPGTGCDTHYPCICGDNSCDADCMGGDEDHNNCPVDCPPICGNGACEGPVETIVTCAADCDTCPSPCSYGTHDNSCQCVDNVNCGSTGGTWTASNGTCDCGDGFVFGDFPSYGCYPN